MTTKTWNGILAVIAALGVCAAVFSHVLRDHDRDRLERDLRRARAELRDEKARVRRTTSRLAEREDATELRRRLIEVEEKLLGEADELSRALEEKGAGEVDRKKLEQDLAALRARIEENRAAMAEVEAEAEAAVEAAREDRSAAEIEALRARVTELEASRAPAADPALREALRRILVAEGSARGEAVRRIAGAEPILGILDDFLRGVPAEAAAALGVLGDIPEFDAARLEAALAAGRLETAALRELWLETWLVAVRREESGVAARAGSLPADLRRTLVARLLEEDRRSTEALDVAAPLAAAEDDRAVLLLFDAIGRRDEVVARLARDLERIIELDGPLAYLLGEPDTLSDLVEVAAENARVRDALRRSAAEWIEAAERARDLEGQARLAVELGILRERTRASGDPGWIDFEALDRLQAALPGLLRSRLDLGRSPALLCLIEPRCLPTTDGTRAGLESIELAPNGEALARALSGSGASRRSELAALARGLERAGREGRPLDHFASALRDDGHELASPFLVAHLDELGPIEAIDSALFCAARGSAEGRDLVVRRLREDVANRSRILERLFAAAEVGIEIAWTVADSDDPRAVFRLIELAMEHEVAMPREVIETILRSSAMDFDRRDVIMSTFRRSLGPDFRAVIHAALLAPETERPEVLLEDLALPPDENLLPVVLRFVESENPRLRESALRVLCVYPKKGLVDRLAGLLRDDDAMVRLQLARCLATTRDEIARGLLMTLTRDTSAFVREAATYGLRGHQGERIRPFLRERLDDVSAEVRIASARALMARGEADAVGLLIAALDEPGLGPIVAHYLEKRFGKTLPDRAAWTAWWQDEGRAEFER